MQPRQSVHTKRWHVRICKGTSTTDMQHQLRNAYICYVVCTSTRICESWFNFIDKVTSPMACAHQPSDIGQRQAKITNVCTHQSWRVRINSQTSKSSHVQWPCDIIQRQEAYEKAFTDNPLHVYIGLETSFMASCFGQLTSVNDRMHQPRSHASDMVCVHIKTDIGILHAISLKACTHNMLHVYII